MSKEVNDWMRAVARDSGVKIEGSAVYAALVSKNFLEEPRCALELGLAILMDKPIVILGFPGVEIPENLRKVARVVESVDPDDPKGMEKAMQSVLREVDQNKN